MKNEKTGKKIATIAGRILKRLAASKATDRVASGSVWCSKTIEADLCTVGELRALAASALTQAPDKKLK